MGAEASCCSSLAGAAPPLEVPTTKQVEKLFKQVRPRSHLSTLALSRSARQSLLATAVEAADSAAVERSISTATSP